MTHKPRARTQFVRKLKQYVKDVSYMNGREEEFARKYAGRWVVVYSSTLFKTTKDVHEAAKLNELYGYWLVIRYFPLRRTSITFEY